MRKEDDVRTTCPKVSVPLNSQARGHTTSSDGHRCELPATVLLKQLFFTGRPGSGKATCVALPLRKMRDAGVPVVVLETKSEFRALAAMCKRPCVEDTSATAIECAASDTPSDKGSNT